MNADTALEILKRMIIRQHLLCDTGLHTHEYRIEMHGYVTPEQMQELLAGPK